MDLATNRLRVKRRGPFLGKHHHVVTRRVPCRLAAEHLAQHPTEPVALNGVPHLAARDKTQPRGVVVTPVEEDHGEMRGVQPTTALLRAEKLRASTDAVGAGQTLSARRRVGGHFS
ncbi:MAG: hypothetical protein U0325_34465 [Polyangiales bacterium]